MELQAQAKMMTRDEILRITGMFVREGVNKIRLTGGEVRDESCMFASRCWAILRAVISMLSLQCVSLSSCSPTFVPGPFNCEFLIGSLEGSRMGCLIVGFTNVFKKVAVYI